MEGVRLNFYSLKVQSETFVVFRRKVVDSSTKKSNDVYRVRLPEYLNGDSWYLYDICLCARDEFEKFECSYHLNAVLSEYILFERLKSNLATKWSGYTYSLPNNSKYKEVVFLISEKTRGSTEIIVHPYYLRSKKLLGFLIQTRFSLNSSSVFDRQVQIESLSLDKQGKPNVFIFRDKELIIKKFIENGFDDFCSKSEFSIQEELEKMEVRELDRKSYIVGNGQISMSQFMGIKNSGPYRKLNENVRYLFIFSERTRSLGRDVYLGLTGKLFPAQFPGLNRMFGLNIDKDLVDHFTVADFTKDELDGLSSYLQTYKDNNRDKKIIMVVALPKGFKGQDSVFDAYGYLKLTSLSNDIYCQFVTEDTFYKKDLLKWSMSNIGLQIFSKLGGAPWLVKPAKSECLIMGLGSSHEIADEHIHKWFAYTVCLDSSGDFKYIKPLSSSNKEENYIDKLKSNLKDIVLEELKNNYKSFVLHLPFKIKKKEVNAIKDVVYSISSEHECEVVVVRINTKHKYLGFSSHNTRVPYEGSYLNLSRNSFLLWPEGLQQGREVLHKRISEPLFIDFIEEPSSWDSKKDCLQDILNLTGANWRGFNSKAQPISILYSKLIADFMKEFSHLEGVDDLGIVEAESVAPWFL